MALQGTIDSFPVVDVLGLLSASAKTGCLELKGDRGHGSLWLRDGKIVAGDVHDHPTTAASEVVFELLLFEEAAFEFVVCEYGQSEPFESSVPEAIEQAEQMLEIWQQVRDVVPELSMQITLATEIEDDEITLSAPDWSLVANCAAQPTVGGVLDELGLGEFEGCRRLADLAERGLVELSEVEHIRETTHDVAEPSLVPDEVVPPSTGFQHDGTVQADSVDDMDGGKPLSERYPEIPPTSGGLGMDLDTDFADDDQSAVLSAEPALSPGFTAVPEGPDGQPVDGRHGSPASEGFPEHFPIDDLVGSGEQVSFDTPPGVSTGYTEVSAFSSDAQPGESGTDTGESAPTDDVLAQIGRLSPKAAEAIAAALGDGEGG